MSPDGVRPEPRERVPGDSASELTRFELHSADVDAVRQLLSQSYAPTKVEPLGRSLRLSVAGSEVDGLTALQLSNPTGARLQHQVNFQGYAIALPISGTLTIEAPGQAIVATPAAASIVTASQLQRSTYSEGYAMHCLLLDDVMLRAQLAERLGRSVPRPLVFGPQLATDTALARTLRQLADTLVRGAALAGSALALQAVHRSIVDLVLQGLPHRDRDALQRGGPCRVLPGTVRRAIDFMQANAARPITLADIAAAAGTAPRSLQQAFRRFHDTTPMAFLRDCRLDGARRDLLDPDQRAAIATIAIAWGFVHLGGFAAQYRSRFGERPSETRRRLA